MMDIPKRQIQVIFSSKAKETQINKTIIAFMFFILIISFVFLFVLFETHIVLAQVSDCTGEPDGTPCVILGESGECYQGSCLAQGLCYTDEHCDYLDEGLCYGECRLDRTTGEQRCYQIGPEYNLVCEGGSCIEKYPEAERGYHIGGDCWNECAVDADCVPPGITVTWYHGDNVADNQNY